MDGGRLRYFSYLLRLWRSGDGEGRTWRASLQSPATGERRGFASLGEMLAFLERQAEQMDEQDDDGKSI